MNNIKHTGEISFIQLLIIVRNFWRFLLSRWIIIGLFALIGALAGIAYALIRSPAYKAELTFAVDEDDNGLLGGGLALASQLGLTIGTSGKGGAFTGDNLLELMRSRAMMKKTLLTAVKIDGREQTLAEYYISSENLRDKWEAPKLKDKTVFPVGLDPFQLTYTQDSLLRRFYKKILKDHLIVDRKDKQLDIIKVQYTGEDELFAKYFTEVLVKEVSEFYVQTITKKEAENLAILEHQADSVQRALNYSLRGSAISRDANPNPNYAMQVLQVPSQSNQIAVQRNVAVLTELVKNLELARITLRKVTPLIQIIDLPDLPLEESKPGLIICAAGGAVFAMAGAIVVLFLRSIKLE
ncbi:MAG TPA: Wzz/FepE/Etk N-terminal domain-containing protein [Sphingobacteriaceae bacterium]